MELTHYLLTIQDPWRHDWVALGFFQQDDIERHFGHFRMSAGCNYYITVKDIINTHSLDRAKDLLNITEDLDEINYKHHCSSCEQPLSDNELLILDEIAENDMLSTADLDHKMAMVYIAGYVAFKNKQLVGSIPSSDPMMAYFNDRNRGKLKCPSIELVNFMLIAFAFYKQSNEQMCRVRLTSILAKFPQVFQLDLVLPKSALTCVSNILMKRFALQANNEQSADVTSRQTNIRCFYINWTTGIGLCIVTVLYGY